MRNAELDIDLRDCDQSCQVDITVVIEWLNIHPSIITIISDQFDYCTQTGDRSISLEDIVLMNFSKFWLVSGLNV